MHRATLAIAPIMLIAGLAIGSAATTLLWHGPIDRAQAQTRRAIDVAEQNIENLKQCTAALRRVAGLKD